MKHKVMILGRAQTVIYNEVQGISHVPAVKEWNGAERLTAGLKAKGFDVTHMTATNAPIDFPETIEDLKAYDVLLVGDIAADTLLLHPDVVYNCNPHPNRLELIKQFVLEGGGLIFTGGWLTFQGVDAKGRWAGTPVEDVLPVHILSMDDRVECPQSVQPNVINPNHPILKGIDGQWPRFMGYSRSIAKDDAETIMTINEDPFLVTGSFGKGRSIAFASSPGPHWGGMKEYLAWEHHDSFWQQCMLWAARELP